MARQCRAAARHPMCACAPVLVRCPAPPCGTHTTEEWRNGTTRGVGLRRERGANAQNNFAAANAPQTIRSRSRPMPVTPRAPCAKLTYLVELIEKSARDKAVRRVKDPDDFE